MPRIAVFWDTETALIRSGLAAPPVVCLSWKTVLLDDFQVVDYGVIDRHEAHRRMRDWLRNSDVLLVGHNVAYDSCVMCAEFPDLIPLFFQAYADDRIEDTMLREQLIDIAEGHYRWEVDEWTDQPIKRKSYALGSLIPGLEKFQHRFGYGPLRDVPLSQWEQGFITYAQEDADATARLYLEQRERHGEVVDSAAQARAAFTLQLMSVWGMRTDADKVTWLKGRLEKIVDELQQELIVRKLIREDGSRDMKTIRQRVESTGIPLQYTATGAISTSADVMKEAGEVDQDLFFLVKYAENLKLLTTYIPALEQGTTVPINARYNTLVETGRTSCQKPNLQNLPRGKKDPNDLAKYVRECFIPRKGYLYSACDYDSLELRTLGQVLYDTVGGTTLKNLYGDDPDFDPHTRLASQIMGVSYEDGLKLKKAKDKNLALHRQMAKAGNFGYPGGMGAKKMVLYAWKGYGVKLTQGEAQKLRNDWLASLPEINIYLQRIGLHTETGSARIEQLRSGRVRGGVGYSDCANGYFQGLASDGAKRALFDVARACYADKTSPLFGSRPVAFIHDEIICEIPQEQAHEAAIEQERLMCASMQQYTPDIPIRASSALMRRWYKEADAVWENGKLVPWEPM